MAQQKKLNDKRIHIQLKIKRLRILTCSGCQMLVENGSCVLTAPIEIPLPKKAHEI